MERTGSVLLQPPDNGQDRYDARLEDALVGFGELPLGGGVEDEEAPRNLASANG